ncbi:MAG: sigma-70 family RNA polymerase sigma factor [Polyangiaceae bacterium]
MSELEQETDAALLGHSARARADGIGPASRAAEAVFYRRHVRYLYGQLEKRKDKLLALAGLTAEDLVQETFLRAFERAHTFTEVAESSLDAHGADPAYVTARTRAWLGRVASHLLADHMNRLREVSASPYLERLSVEEPEPPTPAAAARVALVSEGLSQLSERERDILHITSLYKQVGEEHGRLPNSVAQDLSRRWNTNNDNIRAIRARAMKKLKAFLTSNGVEPGRAS